MSIFRYQLGKQSTSLSGDTAIEVLPPHGVSLWSERMKRAKNSTSPYWEGMPPVNGVNVSAPHGSADFPVTHPDCPTPNANLPSGRLLHEVHGNFRHS